MKIIKEGYVIKHKGKCPSCGCEFEYDSSDILKDGGQNGEDIIHCPQCYKWWDVYDV